MNATNMISFSRQSALSVHNEAMAIAKNLKSEYQKLFEILLVVESRKLYFEFDIPDLKTYCKEMLELSDSIAKEFCIVVRKSLEVPQLAQAIRSGKVSIYKARRISSVINESNHKEWIDLARECSSRIVEKAVAMANPRSAAPESLKYVAGDVLDFRMGVSEEWAKLLARTKDLFSQKCGRSVSADEAIFNLMSEYCKKNDPLEKAKRAEKRKVKVEAKKAMPTSRGEIEQHSETRADTESKANLEVSQSTCDQTNTEAFPKAGPSMQGQAHAQSVSDLQGARTSKPKRRYRPADVEHQVDLRDECQCAYIDKKGNRCQSRRWLHKHHIVGFADGGEHTVENLITLCWAHHKITHIKVSKQIS